MTKVRPAMSIENTLCDVLEELKLDRAAQVTGRSADYLRALSDHQRREQLTVRDLELLDRAHDDQHGTGFPLFQALGRRLETARTDRVVDAAALRTHAVDLARENGEALSAVIEAALASGNVSSLEHALRQQEEAHCASTATLATLRDCLAHARNGPGLLITVLDTS
jgi:hypothetical protein